MIINRYSKIVFSIALAFAGQQFFGMEQTAAAAVEAAAPVVAVKGTPEWDLLEACEKDCWSRAKEIINTHQTINVNAQDKDGWTALHWATCHYDFEMVKFLVSKGAKIDTKANYGGIPLFGAARFGHLDMVRFLVGLGNDVKAHDNNGRTALHYAADYGHLDTVKFLVGKGADVRAKDVWGNTPLHLAAHSEAYLETIRFLMAMGANVNAKNNADETPLLGAAQYGTLAICTFLVKEGATVKTKDNKGRTPLHWAASDFALDRAKFFVEKGADVNAKDSWGTPLHIAATLDHQEMVHFLVENGADVWATTTSGETARDCNMKHGCSIIARYLAAHMAPRQQALYALLTCEDLVYPNDPLEQFPPEHINFMLKPLIAAALDGQ